MRRFLLCMAILLIPALVFGQAQTTGRVTGKVVDEEGNPVAGARVTLISSALQGERIVKTADNGVFLAALLPVGPYAVEISAPGMSPISLSFRLGVGQTVPLDVVLKQGEQIVEEVTVYGTATPLETTSLGENFDYAVGVEELPIQNREVERVAEFAPNVAFGPTPNTLSISGAPSFDTVVLLDGAEVSDPYFGSAPTLYLEDAVEEVQVMTSGISARYGRFQGGVINAITKSGGNTFEGMFRASFNKQSWDSQSPFGEDQSDQLNDVYQVTLGGYMLKDHLWFFLGARTQEGATDASVQLALQDGSSPAFTTTDEEDRWQFKLRGAITSDHIIELNYLNYERNRTDRAGLPAGNILAANGIRSDPREIYTGVYQGVLTPNLFLDFQATSKRVSIQSGPDPARSDASPFFDFGIGAVFNNHWWDFEDPSNRDNDTLGLNLTQAISTSNWGSHTLEYGAQYVNSTTGGENVQSVTGLNMLPVPLGTTNFSVSTNDPTVTLYNMNSAISGSGAGDLYIYRWQALGLEGDQELTNLGVYVQDTWEIDKWRFDVGLRYDAYDGTGPQPLNNFDFSEIAPRLGLTYNINQNWQVQATWGRYISRFNDGIFGNVTGVGAAPYVQSIYTGDEFLLASADDLELILRDDAAFCGGQPNSSCWNAVNFVNDTNQPVQFLGEGVDAPYADDFNFSVRYALPRNAGTMVFAVTDRKFKNLLDDFVGGVEGPDIPESIGTARIVTDPLPSDPNNPASFPFDWVKWDNSSMAERRYQAFTVIADYRPSANWGIGGNYTYSLSQGNYEGEGRNQPAIGTAIGTYVDSRPEASAVPYGTLQSDIPHRLRAWGTYRWNFDRAGQFVLGAVYTWQSGAVWSNTANVAYTSTPAYFNDQGTYTHFYNGRGNQRFQGFWHTDLSGRYQFPIWKRLQGWLKLDVFNFTNEGALTSFNTSGSTDSSGGVPVWAPGGAFGRIESELDYQIPRSYFLTFGLTF